MCICGFPSTKTDRKTVLNQLPTQGMVQRQQTEKPSLSIKEAYLHILKAIALDFPGSPVVKNLPASAGDIGSIPSAGRYHISQSS